VHVVWLLLFGLIVGAIARIGAPGREPGGRVASIRAATTWRDA
jgi:uncharacterized membrane protein YeaQ/YmgE (transglycosylase-associated protein family)